MRVGATPAAVEIVERARAARSGELTITLGTGCCDSTAPFLYEDFWPGPGQEQVGDVAGVPIYAPQFLRDLYADDSMVVDVSKDPADSMSIETEWGVRLTLRSN